LLHGCPSDVRDWDAVALTLSSNGFRTLVPWLRGFGPTRFLDPLRARSGQQAALGCDLHEFIDALGIERAILAGYDWGGRAACVVAALWPHRVTGLVSITGYNIQDIPAAADPSDPAQEIRYWYQWYFQTERGRAGLKQNRRQIARLLWQLWSPNWAFDDATFDATAASFDNPDFVDVTIHSYRHRYRAAPGDPSYDIREDALARQPRIEVPTIVLHGACDGVVAPDRSDGMRERFGQNYVREVVPMAGHFLPREAPLRIVDAITALAN
jgi:pimeloyl-ACP methyl ester carboxylesterase